MKTINIEDLISSHYPEFLKSLPNFLRRTLISIFSRLLFLRKINSLIKKFSGLKNFVFIDEVLNELDCSFSFPYKDLSKIPGEGRLLIAANHPLGGLDGLVLLKTISLIRKDVKIIVTDYLSEIENISDLLLPFRLDGAAPQRESIRQIHNALNNEMAVIMFPAGEVSRLNFLKIKDSAWKKGILFFSRTNDTPVLPVHIKARNSSFFYFTSIISKRLSMYLLPMQLFNKKGKVFSITIGNMIPSKNIGKNINNDAALTKLLRKHVYNIGKKKPPIFKTEQTIIPPFDKQLIYDEILSSKKLLQIDESRTVHIFKGSSAPQTIREIGRLRELTFRKVGEGTGKTSDFDIYDYNYYHLVVWNNEEKEIMGSYRLGMGSEIYNEYGKSGFYSNTLFNIQDSFEALLPKSAEMGRSFIQPKYWRTHTLEHLWMGIGAFLSEHPEIKFLFGPVSISNSYHDDAKEILVHFYKKWYGENSPSAIANNPVKPPQHKTEIYKTVLSSEDISNDYKSLKSYLKNFGNSVPMLFKQYTELCETGGVHFSDFSIDPDFNNCIDGFFFLNLAFLKESKRKRYFPIPEEQMI